MASVRLVAALLSGVCLGACSLPQPDYKVLKYPAPYRIEPGGAVLDNEDMRVDTQGYRIDANGVRVGELDVPAKTAGEASNAMAGFYISSRGEKAAGTIATPSEGASSGAGYGPGSGSSMSPAATGEPAPLTPPK